MDALNCTFSSESLVFVNREGNTSNLLINKYVKVTTLLYIIV